MMNRKSIGFLLAILSGSFTLFSCHNTASEGIGSFQFDSICINETVHLFADSTKPACNLTLKYAYISQSADSILEDSINTILRTQMLGDKYWQTDNRNAVRSYADQYVETYRKDLEPMYLEDAANQGDSAITGAWYSYYKNLESEVIYYRQGLLVYQIDYDEYTGGAHGMYSTHYLNIDLYTKSILTLDQLFTGDYNDLLTDLIWNQLMADNQVTTRDELEEMGYGTTGDITPSENFYLSKDGITFYYNVYDITPYAMGPVTVTIPYQMMEHLLDQSQTVIQELQK